MPDPIEAVPLVRPDGRVRLLARLSAREAARWERIVRRLAPAIERALGPEVLANRTGPGRGNDWGRDLRRARRLARTLRGPSPVLLRTDVRAFYPSVTPAALRRALRFAAAPADPVRDAARLLDGWAELGHTGLPIGPQPSAVLANAVLAPVDAALRRAGLPFLRWVDDYLIALPGERPEPVLERLDDELAVWGLRRAPEKTAVAGPDERIRWIAGASVAAVSARPRLEATLTD